jgi:hypothetical protein
MKVASLPDENTQQQQQQPPPPALKFRNPRRGRPRKRLPRRTLRINEWHDITGWSRAKIYEWINGGNLRTHRPSPDSAIEIFSDELVRLGYFANVNEIVL